MNAIQEFYERKYSDFEGLAGYSIEKNKVRMWFSLLNRKGWINLNSLTDKTCIDLGCGFGLKSYALTDYFRFVSAIDFSTRAIEVANLLNSKPDRISFTCTDSDSVTARFNFITAFGFSKFNTGNLTELSDNIRDACNQLLLPDGAMLLTSSTDFSGKSPSGWYYHSLKELDELLFRLNKDKLQSRLLFPANHYSSYMATDSLGKFDLLGQRLGTKPRTYLLLIMYHG